MLIVSLIIFLNIIYYWRKKLHKDEGREKLRNIKHNIFVNNMSADELAKIYFRFTDDLTASPFAIAFLNNTCKTESCEIRKMENRTEEF